MRFYDVWAVETGNLIGDYATEAEALGMARELLAAGWSADNLSVGWGDTDDDSQGGEIATGSALVALIQGAAESPRSSRAS